MSEKKSKADSRTRSWTCVIYPDSAPTNWRDILDEEHIEWVESPLHDKDVNADGQPKKAHYHVLLAFGGVKSFEQVSELLAPLNCPIPQRCHNTRAMVRYMAHLDNPDKAQYKTSDIRGHGGFDVDSNLLPCVSERKSTLKDMQRFIRDNDFVEFCDFMDYCADNNDDWYSLLTDSCAYIIGQYIKSRRHSRSVPPVDFD